VIDREVAPIWHDRFARMLMRELPSSSGTFALDIHSGPGHTTAELLQRLDESSRVVALGRDPWLMQVSKTRVRPEWKRRVYFKAGDMDDVTGMAADTYDLAVANLVLGEQVVDWQTALAELIRVTKPGGQVLATLPMYGTWAEVEDLFEELLRDENMRREVVTLQKLRRRRPKASQLVAGLEELALGEHDVVVEHERFELLFRSGREFLFAPVVEHGPLGLWKAIIGRAEKPQALFWRFKEAIDTYYAGRVLAVTVVAGLIRIRVPGAGVEGSFGASYWSRYPSLARLWRAPGAELRADEGELDDDELDFDLDLDLDDALDDALDNVLDDAGDEDDPASTSKTAGFVGDEDGSGLSELPAAADAAFADDPFGGLLEELDAEEAAAAEIAAADAAAEAKQLARPGTSTTTLGALDGNASGLRPMPRGPSESGASPLPNRLPRKPGESGASPLPGKLPRTPGLAGKSGRVVLPGMTPKAPPVPRTGPTPTVPGPPSKGANSGSADSKDGDPFAALLEDEELVDFDDIETTEMPVRSESSSGTRRLPPPPPPIGPKKK
jgi:ubiquinone/menaquinone biosynthesis C-methylase UbiE